MLQNELYPVFLKVSQLNILLVGGGNVAYEKLSFMLKSSPRARVHVVALAYAPEVTQLCTAHGIETRQQAYRAEDLDGMHLVIAATNQRHINEQIAIDARARHLLVNVADTPDLCDFYLGSIVTRGPVKIAISTNGQSPTLAKRLRQFLEELLPDNIAQLANTLQQYRNQLQGDFQHKVDSLNRLTEGLLDKKRDE